MPDLDHDIRTYFDALADEIVGDGEFAQPVQLADGRGPRRLRRVLLAVAALAVALGIAGLIASRVAEDSPSTQLDITDDTSVEPQPVEPQPDAGAEEAADGSAVVVLGGRAGDDPIVPDFSIPWRGGTLTHERVRVLGPAPDDVLERYPPEIAELWADRLPATWEEADAELQAAGLGQLGFETAEADPVLRRWFLDASPTHFLTHTVDGVTTEIPFDGFGGETTDIQSIDSNGERLAVAGPGEGPHAVVSVTEDLETWTAIELVDRNPPGVPAGIVVAPHNAEVTVSDWGWAVIGTRYLIGVDPDYLVSLGVVGAEDTIVSVDTYETGVLVVETDNETLRLTETDLGLPEGSGILDPDGSEPPTWSAWAAPWGGEPSYAQLTLEEGVIYLGDVLVVGDAAGFYLTDAENETGEAFATTGGGWYPTNAAPGGPPVSAGNLGLVSGELNDSALGAEFWVSEDLGENWRSVEVLGLEGHTTGLSLDEWPILKSLTRRDAVLEVDGYRVVLTAWFATGDSGLVSARLEDPVSGELLAERTFVDFYLGSFEFVDESGNVLVEVQAATIDSADFGHVGQTEALAEDGPSWRVDTTSEPWVAVPITE